MRDRIPTLDFSLILERHLVWHVILGYHKTDILAYFGIWLWSMALHITRH